MIYELFSKLYDEAKEYTNFDMYVAERGWQEWMDDYSSGNNVDDIVNVLSSIYFLSKSSMRELREYMGLSRPEFHNLYGVPIRTLEDWEYNNNKVPEYTKKLITYTIYMGDFQNAEKSTK